MIKTSTPNDVIRYVYDEVTSEEKKAIENALAADHELMDFYIELLDTLSGFDTIKQEPSERSIDNILNYSKSFI